MKCGTVDLILVPVQGQWLTFQHVSDHVNVPCDSSANATCQPNNCSFPVADS